MNWECRQSKAKITMKIIIIIIINHHPSIKLICICEALVTLVYLILNILQAMEQM